MGFGLNAILEGEVSAYEWWISTHGVVVDNTTGMSRVFTWRGQRMNANMSPIAVSSPVVQTLGTMGGKQVVDFRQSVTGGNTSIGTGVVPLFEPHFPVTGSPYIAFYGQRGPAGNTGISILAGGSARVQLLLTTTQRVLSRHVSSSGNVDTTSANNSFVDTEVALIETYRGGGNANLAKDVVSLGTTAMANDYAAVGNRFIVGSTTSLFDCAVGCHIWCASTPSDAVRGQVRDWLDAYFA